MATSPSFTQDTAAPFPRATRGEASRSTEGPTAAEWDLHRELIKSLYEKKPLKDVRAHLEKHYGFRATCVPSISAHAPLPLLLTCRRMLSENACSSPDCINGDSVKTAQMIHIASAQHFMR